MHYIKVPLLTHGTIPKFLPILSLFFFLFIQQPVKRVFPQERTKCDISSQTITILDIHSIEISVLSNVRLWEGEAAKMLEILTSTLHEQL